MKTPIRPSPANSPPDARALGLGVEQTTRHQTGTRAPNGRGLSVLIVDDHEIARLGLRTFLSRLGAVVHEAGTVEAALAAAAAHEPALVVTEAVLPDGSGLDLCHAIRQRAPGTGVVVLTDVIDEELVVTAVRMGARGCLSKRTNADELWRALHGIARGESRLDPGAMRSLMERLRRESATGDVLTLSAQERRVLALVAQGRTNREIGKALALSEKTVKNYLSRAFEKLNVSRRAQAAVLFTRGLRVGRRTRT